MFFSYKMAILALLVSAIQRVSSSPRMREVSCAFVPSVVERSIYSYRCNGVCATGSSIFKRLSSNTCHLASSIDIEESNATSNKGKNNNKKKTSLQSGREKRRKFIGLAKAVDRGQWENISAWWRRWMLF